MRLVEVDFDNVMGINGRIAFPPNKVVVIYGANLQGKTNIINAIRYAFLKEIKGGRRKDVYDEWALPRRQEIVSNRTAKIEVVFEHQGTYYRLRRLVFAGGRREEGSLFKLSRWPGGEEIEEVEIGPFVKERLKASLLDAVFAPEIAGGFKKLYGKELGQAIGEVFKEVVTARQLSKKFIERLENMRAGAEAEMDRIRDFHHKYWNELLQSSKDLLDIPEFESFQTFEPGKVFQKATKLLDAIRDRITTLEKQELPMYVDELAHKAKVLSTLRKETSKGRYIKQTIKVIERLDSDRRSLHELLSSLRGVSNLEVTLPPIPKFSDKKLHKTVREVFKKVKKAQKLHKAAEQLAKKYDVKLESIKEVLKNVKSLISILERKESIREEKPATITKIGDKAYTIIPIETLIEDPTFAKLSDRPIPKGSEEERLGYLNRLKQEFDDLSRASNDEDSAQKKFMEFLAQDLQKLASSEELIKHRMEDLRENINSWTNKAMNQLSAFIGKPKKWRLIQTQSDADKLIDYIKREVETKKKIYLYGINEKLKVLGIRLEEFDEKGMKKVKTIIDQQRKQLPAYRKIAKSLEDTREEFRNNDELYTDFSYIPRITDEVIPVLELIINESIDEQKLKAAIATTYNEVIKKLKDRKLIEAVAEVSPDDLRAQVKYKGKVITHPAGAEKSFFSLAILSALGHYFRMPILMDEVANNLDATNLQAFFNFVIELQSQKQLQFVLSIKETEDFDLDGWVRDLRDDIIIYKLRGKNILTHLTT